jgi:hypothetical protein
MNETADPNIVQALCFGIAFYVFDGLERAERRLFVAGLRHR